MPSARGFVAVEDALASVRTNGKRKPLRRHLTREEWEDVIIQWREEVARAVESDTNSVYVDGTVPVREGLHGCVEVLFDTHDRSRYAYKIFKLYETEEERDQYVANGWDIAADAKVRHENIIKAPHILRVRTHHATVKVVVMEFCNGGTLAGSGFVAGLGEDRQFLLVPLLRQALQAVNYLHARGIIHTDMLGAEACPGENLGLRVDPITREGRLAVIDLDPMERDEDAPHTKAFKDDAEDDTRELGKVFHKLLGDHKTREAADLVRRLKRGLYQTDQAIEHIVDLWLPKYRHSATTTLHSLPLAPIPNPSQLKSLDSAPTPPKGKRRQSWVAHTGKGGIPSQDELRQREQRAWRRVWDGGRVKGAKAKIDTGLNRPPLPPPPRRPKPHAATGAMKDLEKGWRKYI
ncbi:unnamed protein product [Vitrella brassicaformis CCMP3155]|uniref:Protein kinase domain-containing protein n=1 Tax=Vitrella brassicaformis (strain CCMP3155) TaxID=1169540 RepID=A0A0G4F7K8_VITBC|nr:unnamed protein product [Vitrella brassicaformis CCMP3155]|eukprot:CEM08088.1 unnamed protein product [Vitrella brassicaformis CCMP3155]